MPTSHPFRYAFIVIAVIALFLAFFFVAPFLWYSFDMYCTRVHIRHHQDPEELRAWAQNLIAIYTSSNHIDMMPGLVTNRPPQGIPVSGRFPRVAVMHDHLPDGSYNTWHVGLLWGSGFMPGWGMMIGDTNFVTVDETKTEWKPGIYFIGPE
jgi:hypothetical protein